MQLHGPFSSESLTDIIGRLEHLGELAPTAGASSMEQRGMMNDEQWGSVRAQTGTDILTILMDLVAGRLTPNQAMERIATHCAACYRVGRDEQAAEIKRLKAVLAVM